MPEVEYSRTPFIEAILLMLQKQPYDSKAWHDLMRWEHDANFMVAGATQADVLSDLYRAALSAETQGTTIYDFRKAFDKTVEKHGWDYHGKRGWRTRIIYDTNLSTAHAAGRWMQAQRTKDTRPFLRYTAVLDDHTSELHRQWHGKIFHIDDPFWHTHYPPCRHGCRCSVQTLSERQMQRRGWKVSKPYQAKDFYDWENPNTGEILTLEKGIGVGFDYIPSAKNRAENIRQLMQHKMADMPAPIKKGLSALLKDGVKNMAELAVMEALLGGLA